MVAGLFRHLTDDFLCSKLFSPYPSILTFLVSVGENGLQRWTRPVCSQAHNVPVLRLVLEGEGCFRARRVSIQGPRFWREKRGGIEKQIPPIYTGGVGIAHSRLVGQCDDLEGNAASVVRLWNLFFGFSIWKLSLLRIVQTLFAWFFILQVPFRWSGLDILILMF